MINKVLYCNAIREFLWSVYVYKSFAISFIVTLLSLVLLRPVAIKLKFVDYPSDRKDHVGQVPLIGGISIFTGLLASQIYLNSFDNIVTSILISSSLILILGIWDDIFNLNARES